MIRCDIFLSAAQHSAVFHNLVMVLAWLFIDIGVVTSIEMNHKQIESARKGQAICIKIEPISGESPKMYGRHFDATDELVSKSCSRSSPTLFHSAVTDF
uniref:Uncharacterized protein n=1 Tax=Glossina palpalis gambiensis TaxID=67801 RepID=A0A1B0BIK5_9MUSC